MTWHDGYDGLPNRGNKKEKTLVSAVSIVIGSCRKQHGHDSLKTKSHVVTERMGGKCPTRQLTAMTGDGE
jgi:hypothetical protein